jgi:hypothetical protein
MQQGNSVTRFRVYLRNRVYDLGSKTFDWGDNWQYLTQLIRKECRSELEVLPYYSTAFSEQIKT